MAFYKQRNLLKGQ